MLTATVDDRGRILLPREVREDLHLVAGDEVLLARTSWFAVEGGVGYSIGKMRRPGPAEG